MGAPQIIFIVISAIELLVHAFETWRDKEV